MGVVWLAHLDTSVVVDVDVFLLCHCYISSSHQHSMNLSKVIMFNPY